MGFNTKFNTNKVNVYIASTLVLVLYSIIEAKKLKSEPIWLRKTKKNKRESLSLYFINHTQRHQEPLAVQNLANGFFMLKKLI